MSRVMGYLLRQMSVKRLSGFFRMLRQFLRSDSRDGFIDLDDSRAVR